MSVYLRLNSGLSFDLIERLAGNDSLILSVPGIDIIQLYNPW